MSQAEKVATPALAEAAPDLLAALLAFQKASGGDFIGWHPNYADAIELARKAIARATNPA